MSDLVHIGIVTYNSSGDLPACFAALNAQTYPTLAITVLDNASQDDSVDWVRNHAAHARLIMSAENLGFGRGHNRILAENPNAAYYLPLNPDVRLTPRYIEALVNMLRATGAGWGTGKLLLEDGQHIYSVGHGLRRDGYAINIGYGLPDSGQFDQPREVFGAPGAAPLYTRALITALALDGELFDSDLFMYGEDSDLDWRARRAGWRCWYTPAAVAYHRGSHAQGWLQVQAIGNRYLSVVKNAFLFDLFIYNLPLIAAHCLLRLLFKPRSGLQLMKQLVQSALKMRNKRYIPQLSRTEMLSWYRWSGKQLTQQPVSWRGRLAAFGGKTNKSLHHV